MAQTAAAADPYLGGGLLLTSSSSIFGQPLLSEGVCDTITIDDDELPVVVLPPNPFTFAMKEERLTNYNVRSCGGDDDGMMKRTQQDQRNFQAGLHLWHGMEVEGEGEVAGGRCQHGNIWQSTLNENRLSCCKPRAAAVRISQSEKGKDCSSLLSAALPSVTIFKYIFEPSAMEAAAGMSFKPREWSRNSLAAKVFCCYGGVCVHSGMDGQTGAADAAASVAGRRSCNFPICLPILLGRQS